MFIKYLTHQILPKKSRGKAKSISKIEAGEAEAARKVHDTHARIVTESVPESAKKKSIGRNESTVVSTTSSEGTSAKPGVLDEEKDITKENIILKWGNEDDENDDVEKDDKDGDADDQGDDHVSDTQDVDEEDDETKYDEDGIYKYKIRVRKD
nr:hypothetical protein [Tanacetum cinerariifolium]